jgi:alpha-ribazole phosphatase CobZ
VNKPSVLKQLKPFGVTLDVLVDTGMLMYIYDPAIGKPAAVRKLVESEMVKALNDINIAALITTGVELERLGLKGKLPNISKKKFAADPIDLIADEILGQGIAMYLAGTRALFEFERLDKKKPGIIAKLPPFMDDIVAGLIAGVMVKVCSR